MNDWDFWFATGTSLLDSDRVDAQRILESGRQERWGHRAPIHHRGEGEELYIVVSGGVDIEGDVLVRLRSGDLFGLTDRGAEPQFRAYDDTTIVALERDAFEEMVDAHGLLFSTRVRDKLRLVELAIELPFDALIQTGPVPRLARTLSEVSREHADLVGDRAVLPNLKARHYATLSALDRPTARRAFDALHEASLIESNGGELIVPSVQGLLDYAGRPR